MWVAGPPASPVAWRVRAGAGESQQRRGGRTHTAERRDCLRHSAGLTRPGATPRVVTRAGTGSRIARHPSPPHGTRTRATSWLRAIALETNDSWTAGRSWTDRLGG